MQGYRSKPSSHYSIQGKRKSIKKAGACALFFFFFFLMPLLSLSPLGSKVLALDDPLLKCPRNVSHPFICAPFLTSHHPISIERGKNNCAVSERVNRLNSFKHCCSYSSGARSEFDHSGQFVVAIDTLESMDTTPPPSHPTYDLRGIIKLALAEDSAGRGDVTSMATIPANKEVEAQFLAKEDGIIAGISLAEMVFNEVDPSIKVEWFQKDGDRVHKGLRLGKVYGLAHSIVVAERVALNFMQRMSGIATLTKAMADAAYPAVILETRKTAPGLRLLDKWAVLIGGGKNHRLGLFDMVLIKDNHISIAGGVTNALKSSDLYLQKNNLQMEVEIEARTLEEVKDVLEYASKNKTFLTRILLDNMVIPLTTGDVDVSMLEEAVRMIDGKFETEASGNVTLDTVHRIGQTGVTYISSGALTHSVRALDISLKIDTELALQVGRRTHRA